MSVKSGVSTNYIQLSIKLGAVSQGNEFRTDIALKNPALPTFGDRTREEKRNHSVG